jgi:hypothetical protein
MKYLILTITSLVTVSQSQAATVALTNADFEAGVTHVASGYDAGGADIPGWMNLSMPGGATDTGVEGSGAWWGTYLGSFSSFMRVGNSGYLMSSHTIQAGDEFTIGLVAKTWDAASQFTATLFFDDPTVPANVIGTFTSAVNGTWTSYSNSTAIDATPASVGGTLGIIIANTFSPHPGFLNFDNVSINVVPEPSAALLGSLGALALLRRRRTV